MRVLATFVLMHGGWSGPRLVLSPPIAVISRSRVSLQASPASANESTSLTPR